MILDFLAFGSLLIGVLIDRNAVLAGTPLLVIVGGMCYMCSRELMGLLFPKRLESMESFTSTLAVLIVGFLYFFLRNDSDFILLVITLALMMGSLMLAIALIGCLSERSARPVLQLLGGILAASTLAVLFGHVLILVTVTPNLAVPAAVIVASCIWWRFGGVREGRDAEPVRERPMVPFRRVVTFVSTFLIGCVGAALAGGPLAGHQLLTTAGSVGWLTALAGVVGFMLWEAVRPTLARNAGEQPPVIPFIKGRLLDRMIPLLFISTVLCYYFWTPRG